MGAIGSELPTFVQLMNGQVPSRSQAIIWINNGLCYWRICASVGLDELTLMWRHSNKNITSRLARYEELHVTTNSP